jgi:DNA-binding MarR family transcriptional regulator
MARQGLVKKVKDPKRKGSVRVKLTQKGDTVLRQYMKQMKVVHTIVSCLSKRETDVFMKCLEKLRKKAAETRLESAANDGGYGPLR